MDPKTTALAMIEVVMDDIETLELHRQRNSPFYKGSYSLLHFEKSLLDWQVSDMTNLYV